MIYNARFLTDIAIIQKRTLGVNALLRASGGEEGIRVPPVGVPVRAGFGTLRAAESGCFPADWLCA